MLVKLAAIVAEARGSVGGVTFARNRYGAYARNRTKPVDPSSSKQNQARTRMSGAVTAWRALTADQRDAFNAKALTTDFVNALGESIHPTGMALYVRGHNLLDIAQQSQVTAPPVSPILDDGDCKVGYLVDPGFWINATITSMPAGSRLQVWYSFNLTNSTYYYKGPYTDFQNIAIANLDPGPYNLKGNAHLNANSSMFACWRLVGTDGAASAIRRGRGFKPPA